jgi:flavin-dependent dehydrogenase
MGSIAKVAIIGAGPYGLSIAAHLSAKGIEALVFGDPMRSWREGMPRGMRLKSEGFSSSLSDPEGRYTLKAFCASQNLPYADINLPVPRATFVAYGQAFQKRLVPQLDQRLVTRVSRASHGFALGLEGGGEANAQNVIVATGIHSFRRVPEALQDLSPEHASHSSDHADYSRFAGKRVVVIGAGSSATDIAAELLHEGAEVTIICRAPSLTFYPGGAERRWFDPLIAPMSPVGPGWKKLLAVKAPMVFRAMPESFRTMVVKHALGPAPCWFIREAIDGKVPVIGSSTIVGAQEAASGVALEILTANVRSKVEADHVIAATGFHVDISRLPFLDPAITGALALTEDAPKLSSNFESSVPGLHFVGTMAAYEFGPLLRFVCGAEFTARRIARHIASVAETAVAEAGGGSTLPRERAAPAAAALARESTR